MSTFLTEDERRAYLQFYNKVLERKTRPFDKEFACEILLESNVEYEMAERIVGMVEDSMEEDLDFETFAIIVKLTAAYQKYGAVDEDDLKRTDLPLAQLNWSPVLSEEAPDSPTHEKVELSLIANDVEDEEEDKVESEEYVDCQNEGDEPEKQQAESPLEPENILAARNPISINKQEMIQSDVEEEKIESEINQSKGSEDLEEYKAYVSERKIELPHAPLPPLLAWNYREPEDNWVQPVDLLDGPRLPPELSTYYAVQYEEEVPPEIEQISPLHIRSEPNLQSPSVSASNVMIVDSKIVMSGMLGINRYVLYKVKARIGDEYSGKDWVVSERRYSDFVWLDQMMRRVPEYLGMVLPLLPAKKSLGTFDDAFIERRRLELEKYLRILALHPKFSQDRSLSIFLETADYTEFERKKAELESEMDKENLSWSMGSVAKYLQDQYEYMLTKVKIELSTEIAFQTSPDILEGMREISDVEDIISTIQHHHQIINDSSKAARLSYSEHVERIKREKRNLLVQKSSLDPPFVTAIDQSEELESELENMEKVFPEDLLMKELLTEMDDFIARIAGIKTAYSVLLTEKRSQLLEEELLKNRVRAKQALNMKDSKPAFELQLGKEIENHENRVKTIEKNLEKIMQNLRKEITDFRSQNRGEIIRKLVQKNLRMTTNLVRRKL